MRVRVTTPGVLEIVGWVASMPRVGDAFIVWPDEFALEPILHTDSVVCVLAEGYFVTKTGAYRVVEELHEVIAAAIARRAGQA